jgi:stearoyl-CoA desaturase (delta-9 desaturase)
VLFCCTHPEFLTIIKTYASELQYIPSRHPFCPAPRGLPGRFLDRDYLGGRGALRLYVLYPEIRNYRGLPSLFLPPQLQTSRPFQFFLAFLGGAAAQKGALWWAAHHRHHHKHSDTENDLHSAKLEGFYWSHVGWVLSKEYEEYDSNVVRDLNKYPELVWLDKYIFIPPVVAGTFCFFFGQFFLGSAMMGLVVGFFISTVILYHTTFSINSLCHMFGTRRYETGEESKNSIWLALLTMGEGWHNNHHHYPLSCRQGFFWYELDITYYILLGLEKLGLVWDLQAPPKRMLKPEAMTAIHKPKAEEPVPALAEVA